MASAQTIGYDVGYFFLLYQAGLCSYSAVRREHRPLQRVQSLAGGSSYTGLSLVVIGGDPGSDLLIDRREL